MENDGKAYGIAEGRVVISKSGRDKGIMLVTLRIEGEYIYLTDGRQRPVEKPKKKKIMHIQLTSHTIDLSQFEKTGLKNSDIRTFLSSVSGRRQ